MTKNKSFVEIGQDNHFADLMELLDISLTRPLYYIEAEKLAGELRRYEAACKAWTDEQLNSDTAKAHGKPCYYCGEKINSWSGNPGLWPITLCHIDEPGVPKVHHMECVQKRLEELDK